MNQQIHMLSSSQTNGQFLPILQPLRSLQIQQRHSHMSKDRGMLPPDIHSTCSPQLHSEGNCDSYVKPADLANNNNSHARKMASQDDVERASVTHKPVKKDRKSQARRYLVEGLNTPHYGNSGRGLHRSNTFNHPQSTSLNPAIFQRSMNSRYSKGDESTHERNFLNFTSGMRNISKEDTSKVKKAIENWNELVLEMNSEQCKRFSNADNFSTASDSSSNEDCPSPLHRHRKPLYASHSIFPHNKSVDSSQKGNNTKSNPFSVGLSFSRYRPITPGLLLEMDKNKLSSRKKTQRWINQLEFQSRSYNNNPSSRVVQSDVLETSPDTAGECQTLSGAMTTPTAKTLHRTDSHGSTKTRQSSIQAQSRKQHSDFL